MCSKYCIETERFCDSIKRQEAREFIDNSISAGVVLVANADAWLENQKLFAAGGQGHGFAAENANNLIDRLKGKSATIVGGNNAKNGADRLVDGELVQTKYYSTAARSVGSAFDGQQGDYRYYQDGKPMQLEVPRDQYDLAIKTMKNKIQDGRVPGVTDPAEAENLIVKGNVTYDQARNITKFGTVESLAYDFAEGAVVSLSAAGISLTITAIVVYAQSKNKAEALKAGLISSLKTFRRTATVYVGVQQLHRLGFVQKALSGIDINHLSPTFKEFVKAGTGASTVGKANNALRGTALTTIVVIAVTTGPDILKLCRGRISSQQFLKNLAVASSMAIGGVVGSFAGGALCSPFGPAGVMAGRVVGGMIGGAISSFSAKMIANKLVEDDYVSIVKVVVLQMEYLSQLFMLTESEINNFNENVQKVLTKDVVEKIFAAKEKRVPVANSILKPIAVGIVKQRFALSYSEEDLNKQERKLAKEYRYLKSA